MYESIKKFSFLLNKSETREEWGVRPELKEEAEAVGVPLSCPHVAKRLVYCHNAMPGGDND